MAIQNETLPRAMAGLENASSFSSVDTQIISQKVPATQAKKRDPVAVREAKHCLLRGDLTCNIGALIATLEAALAMRAANDDYGMIYSLRRARAYWRAISGAAAELVAAEAERQSALRQEAAQ